MVYLFANPTKKDNDNSTPQHCYTKNNYFLQATLSKEECVD